MNCELPDVQAGFRKGRGTRDHIANTCWIIKKAREFQKKTSALLTMPKPLTVDHNKLWEILKEMRVSDHLTCLLRNLYAGQEATLELDMEQQTGSKLGKERVKAVFCLPAYLTYMQSPSGEGNGIPLQYSCLENPVDGGAWWTTVHGVTKSQTQLSDSHFHFHKLWTYRTA